MDEKKSIKKNENTIKKESKKKSFINNTIDIIKSNSNNGYFDVDEDMVRKNILVGNKCITLNSGYRYFGIIKSFFSNKGEDYVYVDFKDEETAKYEFKNPSNQKMKISDLAYWVCEKEDYYDIHAHFIPPF